jgi:hypothetical protein
MREAASILVIGWFGRKVRSAYPVRIPKSRKARAIFLALPSQRVGERSGKGSRILEGPPPEESSPEPEKLEVGA